jgi:threonine dehydratase
MQSPSRSNLEKAQQQVYEQMQPTPQYSWPLLNKVMGTELWVKHENHTATGAFKIRGGITFINWLVKAHPKIKGIVTATRGNHGQSQARAASLKGLTTKIVVPTHNSLEKNQGMHAFGGDVIISGNDFDDARAEAKRISEQQNYLLVPPFHEQIVYGVASYAMELFQAVPDLDVIYVPIGCGSGICGIIHARDALGLHTEVVGVVSDKADAAKQSFEQGKIVTTESANTFADGMAVKQPIAEAFTIYAQGASRIVSVTDDQVAEAIRLYYRCTHNLAEGAGAAPLAAAIKEKDRVKHKKVAAILCGGNIDTDKFIQVLNGQTPQP